MSPRVLGIVKVPEMAESLTEGTLKQWIKKQGEYVNESEEIATIAVSYTHLTLPTIYSV